jgi:tetratricopeptide (TPR) repeat protein
MVLLATLLVGTAAAQDSTLDCGDDTEETYVERGRFKLDGEDWAGSVAEYSCALELNPDNTEALFGRGYSNLKLGEYTEAEVDYNRLLELTPDDGAAYNNRGNIYSARGDYERALQDYDRAIELANGEVYISYYNRASIKLETGDYEAALDDVDQCMGHARDGDDPAEHEQKWTGAAVRPGVHQDDRQYGDDEQYCGANGVDPAPLRERYRSAVHADRTAEGVVGPVESVA